MDEAAVSEREITERVDLCTASGRLNPDAVGWTRRPLHRANLRGWGRCKRWEYWGIVTPDHIIGIVLTSLDYAGLQGIYLLDRRDGTEVVKDVVSPLARGVQLPDRSGEGTASGHAGDVVIELRNDVGGTRIHATTPRIDIDLRALLPVEHESLGVVVPWSDNRFQYTVKDLGRPVSGTVTIDGVAHVIDDGFAVLDHGRGKWPYSIAWNWAAGCGPGIGIQLGGRWTDGTGATENGLFVGGRLHKIGDELEWHYDRGDWLRPWRITGPRVAVEFTPFHVRASRTALGVLANETHQCFGHFTGRACADDGDWVELDGLTGWAEEARNRW
ncbi:DUF2804 domain-containing protein [Nocardia sp. NPDC052254]|uniref:DUF2804 domain-containing protein n=1 Tax=Nocardia sp. NPDC052254 TaxID=3155681 RepID=UPI003426D0B3